MGKQLSLGTVQETRIGNVSATRSSHAGRNNVESIGQPKDQHEDSADQA
jgi:hypothetical protein